MSVKNVGFFLAKFGPTFVKKLLNSFLYPLFQLFLFFNNKYKFQ